jgi:hypothetical protein
MLRLINLVTGLLSYVFPPKWMREHTGIALRIVWPIIWISPLALISLLITYLVTGGSRYLSDALSVVLNHVAWQQLRKAGFGNDNVGEISVNADASCPWLGSAWLPLPSELSEEITTLSNKAACDAVPKFRNLVGQLALSKDKEANAFIFSEYLTWDELIHCSYFDVPWFRMLVAYAIAHSEGFRPTEAFRDHPDYGLVADWYEEIKPKASQSAA